MFGLERGWDGNAPDDPAPLGVIGSNSRTGTEQIDPPLSFLVSILNDLYVWEIFFFIIIIFWLLREGLLFFFPVDCVLPGI